MPIRAELRQFYGRDWRAYRAELIRLRGSRCRICGSNVAKYLNLSHTTHDPRTSSVRLLCAACHCRMDAPHRLAVWRRRRARREGQLWLTEQLEYAPYPAWLVPAGVFDGAQTELFA